MDDPSALAAAPADDPTAAAAAAAPAAAPTRESYKKNDDADIKWSKPDSKGRGFAKDNVRADNPRQLAAARRAAAAYQKQIEEYDQTIDKEDRKEITAKPVMLIKTDGVCPNVTIMDKDGKVVAGLDNVATYKSKVAYADKLKEMHGMYLGIEDSKGRHYVCLTGNAEDASDLYGDSDSKNAREARKAAIEVEMFRRAASALAEKATNPKGNKQMDAMRGLVSSMSGAASGLVKRSKMEDKNQLIAKLANIIHNAEERVNNSLASEDDLAGARAVSDLDAKTVANEFEKATENYISFAKGKEGKKEDFEEVDGTVVRTFSVIDPDSRSRKKIDVVARIPRSIDELLKPPEATDDKVSKEAANKYEKKIADKAVKAMNSAWLTWKSRQFAKKERKGGKKFERAEAAMLGIRPEDEDDSSSSSSSDSSDSDDHFRGGGGDDDDSSSDDSGDDYGNSNGGRDLLSTVLNGGGGGGGASGVDTASTLF